MNILKKINKILVHLKKKKFVNKKICLSNDDRTNKTQQIVESTKASQI